jgi:glucosamine--fructose-6-phosphate aminotransferase (isomerizing)
VENYSRIKENLFRKYYKFISQTDTEVIVRLIENQQKSSRNISEAIRKAFKKLKGRNTIIVLTKDGQIIAVRNGSPLVLGFSKDEKEVYFSSDTLSFAPHVDQTITLDNNQMAIYSNQKISIKDVNTRKNIALNTEENKNQDKAATKKQFKHFMLKEIYEQPQVIQQVIQQNKKGLLSLASQIEKSRNVFCIGSGTAGAAASQIAYYLRVFGKINAIGLIGAECNEYLRLFDKNDLIIVPSQSGETADVLEIIERAKKMGVKIASYINMPGSLMTKMSDFAFMANAGPEICVMSTKVFVSQICFGYLLSKTVQKRYKEGVANLKKLAVAVRNVLKDKRKLKQIKKLAQRLISTQHIFLLGKGQNLQIIKEGMIKIIEGSYLHAHAVPAGDLKHYAITLMEPGVPVIAVASEDEVRNDIINAINEVKARGADIIFLPELPSLGEVSAILNIVPLQLLAYFMADYLGNNVDKPRNIAKSVTVK